MEDCSESTFWRILSEREVVFRSVLFLPQLLCVFPVPRNLHCFYTWAKLIKSHGTLQESVVEAQTHPIQRTFT